mgnify:CR=1 FL=1
MSKKIILSTLLSAGLLVNSVPVSASMESFFFFPNGASFHQNMNPNDFFSFLRNLENNEPTPTPTPAPLPPAIAQLAAQYRTLVDQPFDELIRYYTRTFAINSRDENGYHAYILDGQPQLLNIAERIRTLNNMADPIAELILSFINGSGVEVSPERIATFSRLCTQINTEINRINGTLHGISAPKPTEEDFLNGRCIDTHITD